MATGVTGASLIALTQTLVSKVAAYQCDAKTVRALLPKASSKAKAKPKAKTAAVPPSE